MDRKYSGLEIAVIGMSGKFPGADNLDEFWENIKIGKESIETISEAELVENGVSKDEQENPGFVRKASTLSGRVFFDANFFGFSPDEAEILNPQLKQLYQCAWHAIEDSGNYENMKQLSTAVYLGASNNFMWEANARFMAEKLDIDMYRASFYAESKFISSSLAYHFGLKGPAVYLDSACSTSLLAVHMACRSLLTGESKIALAGGVSIRTKGKKGYVFTENGIASKDGSCRSYNQDSTGTIGGEGVGVVVLKKLQDAMQDGDQIHAIIKGSATNNDGRRKVGYASPSVDGQAECIRSAYKLARVEPESIGFIEGHGSGTRLGDPLELSALREVFSSVPDFRAELSSVKSNVGHLDAAAGITGLIKAILVLKNKTIPKAVFTSSPIKELQWNGGQFNLSNTYRKWEANTMFPRRAGVSSFGIGGTNVHVVLEEAPELKSDTSYSNYKLLTLSAKSKASLQEYTESLAEHLAHHTDIQLDDLCYSLNLGRKDFNYRSSVSFSEHNELLDKLKNAKMVATGNRSDSVVFVFSGQGGGYPKMCQGLYRKHQVFREQFDHCAAIIQEKTGIQLADFFEEKSQHNELSEQLLLLSIEYTLVKCLERVGVKPANLIGYSFGEYAAACVAGIMDFTTSVDIIAKRSELIKMIPPGTMMSVPLRKEELQKFLNDSVFLAIDNGESCVVSGPEDKIQMFELLMKDNRLMCSVLSVKQPMHSAWMEPISQDFVEFLSGIDFKEPNIPIISNVTGTWITAETISDPNYWNHHLCNTVQFHTGIGKLLDNARNVYVEIGIGNDIGPIIGRELFSLGRKEKAINFIRPENIDQADEKYFSYKLGKLWEAGVNIDWSSFYKGEKRQKIALPGYKFEKRTFNVDVDLSAFQSVESAPEIPAEQTNPFHWIYFPVWSQKVAETPNQEDQGKHYIVFVPEGDKGAKLERIIRSFKADAVFIRPGDSTDFAAVIEEVTALSDLPVELVYAWNIGMNNGELALTEENIPLQYSFYRLSGVIKSTVGIKAQIRLSVLTEFLHDVLGNEEIQLSGSLSIGIMNVVSQELGIHSRNIDLDLSDTEESIKNLLSNELLLEPIDRIVAFRLGKRWVKKYQQKQSTILHQPSKLRKNGTYVITGGWGSIGQVVVRYLMTEYQANIVLIGRRTCDETMKAKMAELGTLGGRISYYSTDVTDFGALKETIELIEKETTINGLIHAAGLLSLTYFELVEEITFNKSAQILSSKVTGMQNLYEIFKDKHLDFAWFTSSLVTLLGGPTNAAYGAANLFMDYFIRSKRKELPAWNCLSFGTMKIGTDVPENHNDAYLRIFEWTVSQENESSFVVSRLDLDNGLLENFFAERKYAEESDQFDPMERPDLSTDYVEPTTPTEINLIRIVEDLFFISGLGVVDDFFEIGGDSLKAIVLLRRIRKELLVQISLTDFLEMGNIRKVAARIDDIKMISTKVERESKLII